MKNAYLPKISFAPPTSSTLFITFFFHLYKSNVCLREINNNSLTHVPPLEDSPSSTDIVPEYTELISFDKYGTDTYYYFLSHKCGQQYG